MLVEQARPGGLARVEATEGRSDFPTVPFVLYNIIALALQFHIHTKNHIV